MRANRILITSPSLDVKQNVSGISSLVSDIMQESRFPVTHFTLGSRDGEKKNLLWALKQPLIYCKAFYVSFARKFEIVHLNVGLETFSIVRDTLVLFITKKIFRKKILLHVHGGFYLMHPPDKKVLAWFLEKLFANADAVIVLSEKEKKILNERYGPKRFYVFPNAVNTLQATQLTRKQPGGNKIKLIFIGRIAESKGIYTISESFHYLGDYFDRFSLEIFGAGPELEKWTNALSKYDKLQYTYKGVVGGVDKWNALHNADVFLLPSIHSEGMPIAMIEAMAMGCVVIATDDASMGSVVSNNTNGILIGKNEPRELALKLKEIIDGRIDTSSISTEAQKYIAENFSISSYIKQLDDVYAGLN